MIIIICIRTDSGIQQKDKRQLSKYILGFQSLKSFYFCAECCPVISKTFKSQFVRVQVNQSFWVYYQLNLKISISIYNITFFLKQLVNIFISMKYFISIMHASLILILSQSYQDFCKLHIQCFKKYAEVDADIHGDCSGMSHQSHPPCPSRSRQGSWKQTNTSCPLSQRASQRVPGLSTLPLIACRLVGVDCASACVCFTACLCVCAWIVCVCVDHPIIFLVVLIQSEQCIKSTYSWQCSIERLIKPTKRVWMQPVAAACLFSVAVFQAGSSPSST